MLGHLIIYHKKSSRIQQIISFSLRLTAGKCKYSTNKTLQLRNVLNETVLCSQKHQSVLLKMFLNKIKTLIQIIRNKNKNVC